MINWKEVLPAFNVRELTARIQEHNGITYSLQYGTTPEAGYVVSIPGHEQKVPWVITAADVQSYIDRNIEALATPGAHLGVWWDSEARDWVLDVSIVVGSEASAMRLGAEWNQKAIYDIRNGLPLWVPAWMAWTPYEQGGVAAEIGQ